MSHLTAATSLGKLAAICLLIISYTIVKGCCNCPKDIGKNNNYEYKFDAALKSEMSKDSNDNKIMACLIEYDTEAGYDVRQKLESMGLKIHSVTGNIISCEGSKELLRKVATLDFIKRIELSKKLYIQD